MSKKIVLSAIQPTGIFTLGNYLGAVANWKSLQDEGYRCIYFVADLHSMTTNKNYEQIKETSFKLIALLIACGIDPEKSLIFIQSSIPQPSQLAWILQCNTGFGELKRMTQFKDKSLKNPNNINVGLFCYPVLMAADILLYNTDFVPIGGDQKQHLELTKTIAKRFNSSYGNVFKIPEAIIPKTTKRIKSLSNPNKKMSKSDENKNSFISILDDRETIINKFKKAVTDSGSNIIYSEDKPGIKNLIDIYSYFSKLTIKQVEEKFKNESYKNFKEVVGETVAKSLSPLQNKYKEIVKDKNYIEMISIKGAKKAYEIADETLKKVYNSISSF